MTVQKHGRSSAFRARQRTDRASALAGSTLWDLFRREARSAHGSRDARAYNARVNSDELRVLADRARLRAVAHTGLLDSPPEERFDRITRLVSRLLHTSI